MGSLIAYAIIMMITGNELIMSVKDKIRDKLKGEFVSSLMITSMLIIVDVVYVKFFSKGAISLI